MYNGSAKPPARRAKSACRRPRLRVEYYAHPVSFVSPPSPGNHREPHPSPEPHASLAQPPSPDSSKHG
eukprot:6199052-Pleurochrysis_carterae.AAC.1